MTQPAWHSRARKKIRTRSGSYESSLWLNICMPNLCKGVGVGFMSLIKDSTFSVLCYLLGIAALRRLWSTRKETERARFLSRRRTTQDWIDVPKRKYQWPWIKCTAPQSSYTLITPYSKICELLCNTEMQPTYGNRYGFRIRHFDQWGAFVWHSTSISSMGNYPNKVLVQYDFAVNRDHNYQQRKFTRYATTDNACGP